MDLSRLEETVAEQGAGAALDTLAADFRERGEYARMFEALMMRRRLDLGLPLVWSGTLLDLPAGKRPAYEAAMIETARLTGRLFLDAGDIARAWPYLRAIGEPESVREALERLTEAAPDQVDAIVDVALNQGANPPKGYELVLTHHGSCRAITIFDQYPDPATRDDVLVLLMRRLYAELTDNLQRAIERVEGQAPHAAPIPELIAGRDYLFGEYDYYIDTSHLISVLRFSLESSSRQVHELALEMAEYGQRLSAMFHYKADPPFDDTYRDHAVCLRALLGIDVEGAVVHFRAKVEACDPEQTGTYPAQVAVKLLLRLERPREALDVFLRHLSDTDPAYLTCPGAFELCQAAGDFERLKELARARNEPLALVAAAAQTLHPK